MELGDAPDRHERAGQGIRLSENGKVSLPPEARPINRMELTVSAHHDPSPPFDRVAAPDVDVVHVPATHLDPVAPGRLGRAHDLDHLFVTRDDRLVCRREPEPRRQLLRPSGITSKNFMFSHANSKAYLKLDRQ